MHKNKLPLGTILDTSTSFCGKCDPLTRSWLDNKNFSKASIFLQKQITFKPGTKYSGETPDSKELYLNGTMVYHRRYKLMFNWYPPGKEASQASALKYSIKYSKDQFKNCRQELNYRLNLDAETGKLVPLSEFIKSNPNTHFDKKTFKYLPILTVNNAQSESSPLRIVQIPNQVKRFSIPIRELLPHGYVMKGKQTENDILNLSCSFNDNIISYSTNLPPILNTHIKYLLASDIVISDLSDFFKVIEYSSQSAVTQLLELYQDNGKPSIVSVDNYKTSPVTYVLKNQSYGAVDCPASSQIALTMTPDIFSKYSPYKIHDTILKDIKKAIDNIYVDDLGILPMSDYVLKFFSNLPPITSEFDMTLKTNKLCTLCKNIHGTYNDKMEIFIPFNCTLLKDCKYVSDINGYNYGPYMQDKSGLYNMMSMLTGCPPTTIDISKKDFYKKLYSLNNVNYTKFIKALTRHYNLLMIYNIQVVVNFCNFYFKELLTTDSILNEILPYFLTKDKKIADAKEKLKYMRPPASQIREELKSKIVLTKADKKKPAVDTPKDIEFESQINHVMYDNSVDKIDCYNDVYTPVYSGGATELVMYSDYLLNPDLSTEQYKNICCYENINTDSPKPITQLGRDFISSKTQNMPHCIFGSIMLSKKHRQLALLPNPVRKIPITVSTYTEAETIFNREGYYLTKRSYLGIISQLFDITGTFLAINTLLAKYSWRKICKLNLDWDEKIPDSYIQFAKIFCKYFFIACKKISPRCNILLHPKCTRYLIYMSDAGKDLFAYTVHLITYIKDAQNNVIQGENVCLLRQSFTNIERYSVELNELYGFTKASFMAQVVHDCLKSEGLDIPKSNIIGISDSTITIFQLRYLDTTQFRDLKVRHLVAKVQLIFGTNNMDLIQNIRLWDQTILKFNPDYITKLPSESPSMERLEEMDNMSKTLHPSLMENEPNNWKHLKVIILVFPSASKGFVNCWDKFPIFALF